MLIRLLSNYAVWLATTCMMIKMAPEAGGGVIAGIGFVSGVRCLVSTSNSAIRGGTMSPMGVQKTLRLQKIALEQKLPMITLTESGGANLNYAAEVFTYGGMTLPIRHVCLRQVFHNLQWYMGMQRQEELINQVFRTM